MGRIVDYCNTNYKAVNNFIYKAIFLCSFTSMNDFVTLVDFILHIANKHVKFLTFLFPSIENETFIPDIRNEYLLCLDQLSEEVRVLYIDHIENKTFIRFSENLGNT